MLLDPTPADDRMSREDLARFEESCLAFYSRYSRDELRAELEAVLTRLVDLRRDLHRSIVDREPVRAHELVQQLLGLEAQASAVRRVHGDLEFPPRLSPPGPQDRRKERRRTARE